MNLRVFYLTRRGISDGYVQSYLAPCTTASHPVHNSVSPRCERVSPQMRLHLAQEAIKKRHSLKSLNYHHVTHH